MTVTKVYEYSIEFEPGSSAISDFGSQVLAQVTFKARRAPEHRIEIIVWDGPGRDSGTRPSLMRLEAIRKHFISKSIPEARLEPRVEYEARDYEYLDTCAEVRMFPRVSSFRPDPSSPLLDYDEVHALDRARAAHAFSDYARLEQLIEANPTLDWQRIVGHDSPLEWSRAGGHHPLYGGGLVGIARDH